MMRLTAASLMRRRLELMAACEVSTTVSSMLPLLVLLLLLLFLLFLLCAVKIERSFCRLT